MSETDVLGVCAAEGRQGHNVPHKHTQRRGCDGWKADPIQMQPAWIKRAEVILMQDDGEDEDQGQFQVVIDGPNVQAELTGFYSPGMALDAAIKWATGRGLTVAWLASSFGVYGRDSAATPQEETNDRPFPEPTQGEQ